MELKPIGVIHTPFEVAEGTPIQPLKGRGVEGGVEIYPEFTAALRDLEGFDRVWLIYWLHRAAPFQPVVTPFMDDTPRGLFATRAPSRPNPLGLSSVELIAVEGSVLRIRDVDMLNGTPLLDIKPHVPQFDHHEIKRCGWLDGVSFEERTGLADSRFEDNSRED